MAEGCQFDTNGKGWCSLVWLGNDDSHLAMAYYPSIDAIIDIHGHGGKTRVVWIDDESHNVVVKK